MREKTTNKERERERETENTAAARAALAIKLPKEVLGKLSGDRRRVP